MRSQTPDTNAISREAATAHSCGRKPADLEMNTSSEPRSGDSSSRHSPRPLLSPLRGFAAWDLHDLRAYARSYVLSSLRDLVGTSDRFGDGGVS